MQIRSSLNGFLVNEDISSCGGTDVNIVDIGKADFGSSNVSMILIFRSNGFGKLVGWLGGTNLRLLQF